MKEHQQKLRLLKAEEIAAIEKWQNRRRLATQSESGASFELFLNQPVTKKECGQGQNRTADTRIFSPDRVPGLCVTIGRQLNESKRFTALRVGRFYRFEHIVPNGSDKVVTK